MWAAGRSERPSWQCSVGCWLHHWTCNTDRSLWPAWSCCSRNSLAHPTHICNRMEHDDVIKWKHFPRYWHFVRGIHLSPVNSPHKGQWRGALKFSLMCAWINGRLNTRGAGDLSRHRAHYDPMKYGNAAHMVTSRQIHWFANRGLTS